MKILLTAINAKYIHSNLAVYCLKAYADKYRKTAGKDDIAITFREFTINHRLDEILEELYQERPDVLCFSCYIWNISYVRALVREIKLLLPNTDIWLGGPEVSYNGAEMLEELLPLCGIMYGEGEKTFTGLCEYYGKLGSTRSALNGEGKDALEKAECLNMDCRGVIYRNGGIFTNPSEQPVDMSDIPFPYGEEVRCPDGMETIVPNELAKALEHRMIYYESSRGCPFSCSYCLSSIDKSLRFRSISKVKRELQFFLDYKVSQVKFVDRTFNCKKEHALAVWKYILEHDNGVTNFHFEIGADLLDEEELKVLQKMRPGLVQLEIGVQSTNDATIREVSRKMNLEKLKQAVLKIREFQNINLHLDLIAGLPYEDFATFQKSFNEVYRLYSDQLQLGFLKVLKGSAIAEKKEDYGIAHRSYPPYEVLYTDWMNFDEMHRLKLIEEMVENYYNSGQFTYSLRFLEEYFQEPFLMFQALGAYYETHFDRNIKHARIDRYRILLDFFEKISGKERGMFAQILTFDLYLRENMKTRPAFAVDVQEYRQLFRSISTQYGHTGEHIEAVSEEVWEKLLSYGMKPGKIKAEGVCGAKIICFDYSERNPLNHNAAVYEVEMTTGEKNAEGLCNRGSGNNRTESGK